MTQRPAARPPRIPRGAAPRRLAHPLLTAALLALAFPAGAFLAPPRLAAQEWTLVDAVRDALAHHPAVTEAAARVDAADAALDGTRSAWLPSIASSASAVRFAEPMVVAPLHGFDPTRPPTFDDALVRTSLGLSYTLFDGGGRRAARSGAAAGSDAAAAGRALSEVEVIHTTVDAFVAVRAAAAVVRASDRRREALTAEVERADRLFREGVAAEVETLRARAALAQADADHASAQARLAAARSILARLTGRTDAPLPPELPEKLDAPFATRANESAGIPEIRAAQARLAAAEAQTRAARSAFLPRVQLASSLDQYGATGAAFSNEWQAGVQVSFPLFLGGARFAQSRRSRAQVGEARAALDRLHLELASRRDQAVSAYTEAEGRVAALTSAVRQFEEVARVEALAVAEGSGVQRDLLAAEASLFAVRADLARAQSALLSARVALARLDGDLTVSWLTEHVEMSR